MTILTNICAGGSPRPVPVLSVCDDCRLLYARDLTRWAWRNLELGRDGEYPNNTTLQTIFWRWGTQSAG